jgi:hypothetical protein
VVYFTWQNANHRQIYTDYRPTYVLTLEIHMNEKGASRTGFGEQARQRHPDLSRSNIYPWSKFDYDR